MKFYIKGNFMRLTWKQIHKDSKTIFALNSSGVFLQFLMGLLFIDLACARKTRQHISSQDSPLTTLYNKTNLSLCFFHLLTGTLSTTWRYSFHLFSVFSLVIPNKTLTDTNLSDLTLEAIGLNSTNVQE